MDPANTPPYTYVAASPALECLVERVKRAERVPLDTEGDSLHHYFHKVCLLQITLDEDHYLVDPLVDLDLSPLMDALSVKPLLFHGADYDLRQMRSSFGFAPKAEIFDTMLAAQLLGYEQFGLVALLERFFDVKLTKQGQKSDWSRRPLYETQLCYAVNDTRYLTRLADTLREKLRKAGREDWHREACRRMVESAMADPEPRDEDAWRIKGVSDTTPREAAFVRALWYWRDGEARQADLPPFKVYGNPQLLDLARWAAAQESLKALGEASLPGRASARRVTAMRKALREAYHLPETEHPAPRRPSRGRPMAPDHDKFATLQADCARIAAELGIPPSVLAPRATLNAVLRHQPRTVDEMVEHCAMMSWQAELLQPSVHRLLDTP